MSASKNPQSTEPKLTPAMRQYARFKEQYPDCILFFRMGDFYEMFYDDAVITSRDLGITLTQRSEGVPMAGVPHHAMENYLQRMLVAGHRVAICDQIQDPKDAKGVVERAVTRVLTPGTLVDDALLDDARSNVLAAIQFVEAGDHAAAVLACCELSTGAFHVQALRAEAVLDEVMRRGPTELLYVETADGQVPPRVERLHAALACSITPRPAWTFRLHDAGDLLRTQFGLATLNGLGLEDDAPVIGPAGALVRFLQETQAPDGQRGNDRLAHLQPPRLATCEHFVTLDATTIRSLEIERTMRSAQTEGSLLSVFPSCRTSMGKRLRREWLCYPLREQFAIEQRQRVVRHLVKDRDLARELLEHLEKIQDVARIVGRIVVERATPRDLVALGRSLAQVEGLRALLSTHAALDEHAAALEDLTDALAPLASDILRQCNDAPPPHTREGGIFRDGIDKELDEARSLENDANAWLATFQAQLIEETQIPSLKVGYNKVFGYYIEVTHAHTGKVPDAFTRKQTLKNAERYITPELKEFEDKVLTASTRAIEREKILFSALCRQAATHVEAIGRFGNSIGALDVLQCFAETSSTSQFVCPEIVSTPCLHVEDGRHPVLDREGFGLDETRFVPNDIHLGPAVESMAGDDKQRDDASLALITGPNMAGKSTYIRQAALITLLAHTGSFVPAKRAVVGLVDRIFTRIGASDELHTGMSTFMVEMTETANILHHATDRSLVILDEIGRGTSTLDGLSLAWSIAETLSATGCRTMFATHYHELTSLADQLDNVTNLHVAVREWGERIIFLYRILEGRTDRSYGIHVARIAGVPAPAIARAQQLLDTLSVKTEPGELPAAKAPIQLESKPIASQMSLFTEYIEHPVIDALRQVMMDTMTPMDAFDTLRELRRQLEDASSH